MKAIQHTLFFVLAAAMAIACSETVGPPSAIEDASGPYQPAEESLAAHNEAPDWFRDAKLGIYFHWGPYAVPAYGNEWYPRWMNFYGRWERGTDYYEFHKQTYGEPHEVGYHDLVDRFTAEHFDPEAWADLFVKAGARFAGPVAEHHDGFAMWDSDATPWNAADKGPQRDVTGELATAIRARGMKFVTTFHHARNLQRYRGVRLEDAIGYNARGRRRAFMNSHYPWLEDSPVTSDDPELRLLYGNLPEEEWLENVWLAKLKEVVDNYQPDLIWFDSWLDQIPEPYRNRFGAHYLNRADEWGKEVVITRKQDDLPLSWSIEDFEKGRTDRLTENSWLTDDTISLGSWSFTTDLKIKTPRRVIHDFIDIVSKNGQLLLNISPRADGTIPEDQEQVLLALGAWLDINGEAIYETRPWTRFGEGPTRMGDSGHFTRAVEYTPDDIRFTTRDDTLYAIQLGWPGAGEEVTITSLSREQAPGLEIRSVAVLGSEQAIAWRTTPEGLVVTAPEKAPDPIAVAYRIETGGY